MSPSLSRNALFRVSGVVVPACTTIVLTPLFVRQLGTEQYGLWVTVVALIGFSRIVDWGLTKATAHYYATHQDSHTSNRTAYITLSFSIFFVLALAAGLTVYTLAPTVVDLLDPPPQYSSLALDATHLAAPVLALNILRQPCVALLYGNERYDLSTIVFLTYDTLFKGGMALILVTGYGLTTIFSWLVVVATFTLFTAFVALFLAVPHNWAFSIDITRQDVREFLSYAGYAGTADLGARLFNIVDRLLVSAILGPSAVTYYAIPVSVANKIASLSRAVSEVLMPRVSRLRTELSDQAFSTLAHLFRKVIRANGTLVLAISSLLFLCAQPLFTVWIGPDFADRARPIFRILLIAYSCIGIASPAIQFSYGIQEPRLVMWSYLTGGTVSLAGIALLGHNGLHYVAMANLGFTSILLVPVLVVGKLHMSFTRGFLKPLAPSLALFVLICTTALAFSGQESSIGYTVAGSALVLSVWGGLAWLTCRSIVRRTLDQLPLQIDF